MCVRCGTGRVAWCTSPDNHVSEEKVHRRNRDKVICHACGHHHPDRETVYLLLDGRFQCMNALFCTSTQNQDGMRSGH